MPPTAAAKMPKQRAKKDADGEAAAAAHEALAMRMLSAQLGGGGATGTSAHAAERARQRQRVAEASRATATKKRKAVKSVVRRLLRVSERELERAEVFRLDGKVRKGKWTKLKNIKLTANKKKSELPPS